jgi:hypothetical protein
LRRLRRGDNGLGLAMHSYPSAPICWRSSAVVAHCMRNIANLLPAQRWRAHEFGVAWLWAPRTRRGRSWP